MKDYLLNKMFDRVVIYIRSVKKEPYLIKNALYLLDKLDIIPAFKQQVEDLEAYMKDLKERFYSLKDMKSIIDRITGSLAKKKSLLPERPIEKNKAQPTVTPAGQDKSPAGVNGSNSGPSGTPQTGGGQQTPQPIVVEANTSQPPIPMVIEKSKTPSATSLVSDTKPRS